MICNYKTSDGYCELHSDGVEFREPCIDGPCEDANYPENEATP